MKPRCLISGCAGFLGSNVINTLSNEFDCWGVDNLKFGYADNVKVNNWSRCGFETLTENFLKDFDVLVHLACANIIYAMDEPVDTMRTNAYQSIELFKKFKGKIIYTSTASVYGNSLELPTTEKQQVELTNAYSLSKYIAEQYLMERGDYTTLRLSNVYGTNQRPDHPYSGVIGKFIGAKELTIFGDGSHTRDYTFVSDVVEAIRLAILQDAKNTEINISGGVEYSVNDIATLFNKPVKYVEARQIDTIKRRWIDNRKALELLGWEPKIGLVDGIAEASTYLYLI